MQVLFLSILLAQSADDLPLPPGTNLTQLKSEYLQAAEAAVKANRPLIVFSQVPQRKVSGLTTVYAEKNFGKAGIVVMVPNGRGWFDAKMYPASMSNDELRQAAGLEVADAIPFAGRPGEVRIVDADGEAIGRWPDRFESWKRGMVRYTPTKVTQSVFNRTQFNLVSRSELEMKWRVPGGMEGVHGWHSALYAHIPSPVREFRGPVAVLNSFNNFQTETSNQREFPDGTYFVDALSNGRGELFELRLREKVDGLWESSVAYREASARPRGYVALKSSDCAGCHLNHPGTGGYAVGLVPGGDGVISLPFRSMEGLSVGPWYGE